MNCELTNTPENVINPPDNGDESENTFIQRVTNTVNGYIASDSDLDDAIINDDDVMRHLRNMYRAYSDHDLKTRDDARLHVCMAIDSYLINRATKEVG